MSSQPKIVQKCVHISLLILGFSMSPKYALRYTIVILCCMLLMVTGSTVGYLTQSGISERLEILSLLLPQLAVLLASSCVFVNKQNILKILEQMKRTQHSEYILQRTNTFVKDKVIWYIIMTYTTGLLAVIPPLLYFSRSTSISDKNSFLSPYWFSCGDQSQKSHTILKTICWPVRTKIQLLLSNVIQGFIVMLLISTNCARMILHIVSIKELLVHVEILITMIYDFNSLNSEDHITDGKSKNKDIEQEQYKCDQLVEIIKYQQFIKSLVHGIINAWNSHNTVYAMSFSAIFILLIFIIIRERNEASILAFKATCITLISSLGFIFICIFGHVLSTVNEDIFNAWCNIQWHQQSLEFRKMYSIALTQNITPVHMKVFGIHKLNLPTIFKFLKTAYSMLNVLLLVPK